VNKTSIQINHSISIAPAKLGILPHVNVARANGYQNPRHAVIVIRVNGFVRNATHVMILRRYSSSLFLTLSAPTYRIVAIDTSARRKTTPQVDILRSIVIFVVSKMEGDSVQGTTAKSTKKQRRDSEIDRF
jgi:hypothetical protein